MLHRISFIIFFALLTLVQNAQETTIPSRISEVTVYRNLARETRRATSKIKEGYQEVVISGVSTHMNDQSLQVSLKGNATLLSARVRMNYFVQETTLQSVSQSATIRDTLLRLETELNWIEEERIVYNNEIELVNAMLKPEHSEKGYTPSDMLAMADIHRQRMTELRRLLFDLSLKTTNLNSRRESFQGQLDAMSSTQGAPVKEIVLALSADAPGEISIRCAYLVGQAGWLPAYDIHAKNTIDPIELAYKAKVIQRTGTDWKDVELEISTANPGVNNNRPLLQPQYVDYETYRFNDIQINESFGITNMMQAQRIDIKPLAADAENYMPDFSIQPGEEDILLEVKMPTKQTIRSDGREYVCSLRDHQLPATFRYHTVPKLEQAAFLMARITNYGSLQLLSGDANIFFGETFIGQVNINPMITSDTLMISLGRDDRIIVRRTRVGDTTSKKHLSDKEKTDFEYMITIKNNKGIPIDIEILDQVPLSRKDEIKVKLNESDRADYNEKFGKLLWQMKVKPGESKKIRFGYTIEYPEGKSVSAR